MTAVSSTIYKRENLSSKAGNLFYAFSNYGNFGTCYVGFNEALKKITSC